MFVHWVILIIRCKLYRWSTWIVIFSKKKKKKQMKNLLLFVLLVFRFLFPFSGFKWYNYILTKLFTHKTRFKPYNYWQISTFCCLPSCVPFLATFISSWNLATSSVVNSIRLICLTVSGADLDLLPYCVLV